MRWHGVLKVGSLGLRSSPTRLILTRTFSHNMLVVYSDKHAEHDPKTYFTMGKLEAYPETPSRAITIHNALLEWGKAEIIEPTDHGIDPILSIHSAEYTKYLESSYKQWVEKGGCPDGVIADTFGLNTPRRTASNNYFAQVGRYTFDTSAIIVENTWAAAYMGCQVALTATKRLVDELRMGTFALCRPPGHHSDAELSGGFCYLNNAAVAAQYLVDLPTKPRVAILDVDYHHGNGTQMIFYKKMNPLFVSLHGEDDYPFHWGSKEEIGEEMGEGFNVNVPLPIGTEDRTYLDTLSETIKAHIIPYRPDYLVVSLGVDTFRGDPVGGFSLSSEAFVEIGQIIRTINVPTVFIMEGGYAVAEIGVNVCNVLKGYTSS